MEVLKPLLGLILFLGFTLLPSAWIVSKSRTLNNGSHKSTIYLLSELSYLPQLSDWNEIRGKLKTGENAKIFIPLSATWRGMIAKPFSHLGEISIMWYGLFLLSIIILSEVSKYFSLQHSTDSLDFLFVIIPSLCWFLHYFRSFSTEQSEIAHRAMSLKEKLIELDWDKFPIEIIDTIKEEIKIDFDLYKKETDIGGLIILLLSSSFIFQSKIQEIIPNLIRPMLILLFISIFISQWLYNRYRTNIINIAINGVYELKKSIQLQSRS